jgi:hypothetical protein
MRNNLAETLCTPRIGRVGSSDPTQGSVSDFAGVWIGDLPEAEQLKRFNRLKDQLGEIGKRAENCLTGEWRVISEEYVNGSLSLIVYLHAAQSTDEPNQVAMRHGDVAVSKSIAALVFDIDLHQASNVHGGNEQFMLVDIVKLADFPQLKLPSRVRLYFVENKRGKIGIHLSNKPKGLKGLHVAPSLGHWKADPIGFGIGKLCDDMIESGAEIVNGISNDGRDFRWIRGRQIDLNRICSGLTVFLGNDYGEVRFEEGHNHMHKFLEMTVCPRDLKART